MTLFMMDMIKANTLLWLTI